MKYTLKTIICAIFFITGVQFAHAQDLQDLIDCIFVNTDGSDVFEFQIKLKEDAFYMQSNYEEGYESALTFHIIDDETLELFEITKKLATNPDSTDFHPRVTFVELLGSGGVNTTTINIVTKEAWHSRHTSLLTQYKGKCKTDIF